MWEKWKRKKEACNEAAAWKIRESHSLMCDCIKILQIPQILQIVDPVDKRSDEILHVQSCEVSQDHVMRRTCVTVLFYNSAH